MKIYIDGVRQDFPSWITLDSSTSGINVDSGDVNDRGGEVVLNNGILKAKTFPCAGIVQAVSEAAVELEVTRLMSILAGKELIVYRTETSPIFYRCRLSGDIKYSYYNGYRINKAFNISFTLKSFEPYGFGELSSNVKTAGASVIANPGNDTVIPVFTMTGAGSLSGTFLTRGATAAVLDTPVTVGAGEVLVLNESGLFLNGIDISDRLSDSSLLHPFSFVPGNNSVVLTMPGGTALITFNPRYK